MANPTLELIVNHDDGSYYYCSPLAARLSADCSSQCCEHHPGASRNYHQAAPRCGQHHCRHQSGGLQSRICNTTHASRRRQPAAAAAARLMSSFLINLIVVTLLGAASRTTNTYYFVDALTEMANTEPQFSNYPTTCPLVRSCQCKWSNGKQIANCDRQNLSAIPGQLPPDTQVLEMNGNNLIQLSKNIFQDKHMTNLQKIFLSECKISTISDEAFAQLTNLIELDLSHNNIQQVPTRSFERLNHALRKLSLAHNRIQVIESNSFAALTHLDVLDLSNNHLSHLRPSAFRGLSKLRELKLNDNKLTHLPANVIIDLNYFFTIDLYGNPWHCDCLLHQSIEFMVQNNVQQSIQPTCATPQRVENIRWSSVKSDDYMCPPVLVNKQVERVVGAGSNISFECTAHGSHPMTFVWYQDERNLTTNQQVHQSNNSAGPIQSTKLLEERRYEIAEEKTAPNMTTSILFLFNLQMTDTSLFLCWVENPVGNSMANFSLIVNDSPPAGFADSASYGTGAGGFLASIFNNHSGEAQLGMMALLFAIVLLVVIVLLLIVKQSNSRSSKSSQSSDLKQIKSGKHQQQSLMAATISSGGKFANSAASNNNNNNNHQRGGNMFADSEDDVDNAYEEDGRSSSVGSSSSCKKNPKVMVAAGDHLDGFIEHMRSGIINMDYHSMSPVVQFNNTMKNNQNHQTSTPSSTVHDHQMLYHIQQQQQAHLHHQQLLQQQQLQHQQLHLQQLQLQQQPYLDTTDHHMMHHFPSASNASTLPCYYGNGGGGGGLGGGGGGGGAGTASMTTTTSDLSPSSGSGNTNFTATNGPPPNLHPHYTMYVSYPE